MRYAGPVVGLGLVACFGADEGTVADTTPSTDASVDTTPSTDASVDTIGTYDSADMADIATGTLALPIGTWVRETIGDCIGVSERLTFGTPEGKATWVFDDNNFCRDPDPFIVRVGPLTVVGDHVLAMAFERDDVGPREVRWTWAIVDEPTSGSAVLMTNAFRRTSEEPVWHREHREIQGSGSAQSDKRLDVSVTLEGYPDVTKMVVAFDVSWRFGDGGTEPTRGGSGFLTYAATRTKDSKGRQVIAASGYDIESYPDRYRFSQELLKDYDGYTVDLVSEAVFPVLYEVSGDPDSLVFDYFGAAWTAAAP